MIYLVIILSTFLLSSAMFIFWVAKGGFNRKYLYTDNVLLSIIASVLNIIIYHTFSAWPIWIHTPFINGSVVLFLFILLFFYRFFRNPKRQIPGDKNDLVSGADGRVIYIREIEKNQPPISIKKQRISNISEITKTDILEQPCYLVGIAMTLFDVHMNRSPIDGRITFIQHTEGTAIGLNTPSSTITNERNTVVFTRDDNVKVGVVQIAARGVRRCIITSKMNDQVKRGDIIGKIRWGSQFDMIIPRNCKILVREGEQVHAGSTIIARYENGNKTENL